MEGREAYDPAKPNDYMEYCKVKGKKKSIPQSTLPSTLNQERLQKKKQEERQREYEKYRKEREEEQGLLPGLGFAGMCM